MTLSLHLSVFLLPFAYFLASVSAATPASMPQIIYRSDFAAQPVGPPPPDMRILAGELAIVQGDAGKYLELAGAPIAADSLIVGPETDGLGTVQASIRGTSKGKRCPEFGIALGGTAGYKLWLMPMTNQVQIVKADEVLAKAPFAWHSGQWTTLRLQISQTADGCLIQGKAWDTAAEPEQWTISLTQSTKPPTGPAVLYGTPYSETPIGFDRIVVSK